MTGAAGSWLPACTGRATLLALLLGAPASALPAATATALLERLEQAGADSGHGWVACPAANAPPASPGEASLQYLPAVGALLAWREFAAAAGGRCVLLDWPQSRALSARQAHGLQTLLERQQAAAASIHGERLATADVAPRTARTMQPAWLPAPVADPGADRPTLPWCPRTPPPARQVPVDLPERVAPLLVRVRPHRCAPGSRPAAGSGALLAPDLALTSAHVILSDAGQVCDRYRVIPGGRRYSTPPAAPFGLAFVSRAHLSERGGWNRAAAGAPALNADFAARTAHDYAWLRLDQEVALPASVHWPRLRFLAGQQAQVGQRVLRAGYPVIGPGGRIAPGAAVNSFGQVACARGRDERYWRFALWMGPGASGGPIWRWPERGPFELLSLAARIETHGDLRQETLGPRFDEHDYQRLLRVLAAR